ncbi:hypothetical protein CDD83_10344 [Cordyceps sp. RAO-2017]|nr:hypothetical protein CDD83_10344 [Cordyceps sp. RAO-2017]
MKLFLLIAVFTFGAFGSVEVQMTEYGEARMRAKVAQLQRDMKIVFNENQPIRNFKIMTEHTCWVNVALCGGGTTFAEDWRMTQFRKGPNGFLIRDPQHSINATVFMRRHVVGRVLNYMQGPGSYTTTREKSSVTVESTTAGWTVGAQLSLGTFDPARGGGGLGATISGSYSSQTTNGTQVTLGESDRIDCPPNYVCWIEAWVAYVRITGICQIFAMVACGGDSVDPCTTFDDDRKLNNDCEQVTLWRDRVCRSKFRDCEVTTPLMDGDTPWVAEVALSVEEEEYKPPEISGYKSGYYQLGSDCYRYRPSTDAKKRYWKCREQGGKESWYKNKAYPDLEDQVSKFRHEVPEIIRSEDNCYLLDSEEWYCPNSKGDKKYYSLVLGTHYAKPTAPEPDVKSFVEAQKANKNKPEADEK